jgi:hypothetical protein
MRNSKRCLDDLQEAINAVGKKNPPQLLEIAKIRQRLHRYWGDVANFMQVEGFQTTKEVVGLQYAEGPSQLITALGQLKAKVEGCRVKAEVLVGQHDEFIRFFGERNLRFRNPIIASFTQACRALRAGLVDLLTLIKEQCKACATYEITVRAGYKPIMLDRFARLGKEWKPYVAEAKETHKHIKKLSDDIIVPGVKQFTVSNKGCCVII